MMNENFKLLGVLIYDGQTDKRTNKRTNELTDEQTFVIVESLLRLKTGYLQTIVKSNFTTHPPTLF